MYQLLKQLNLRLILTEIAPSLVVSLWIAEAFYKFGSFTLECIFFLATFFCLSYLIDQIKVLLSKINSKQP